MIKNKILLQHFVILLSVLFANISAGFAQKSIPSQIHTFKTPSKTVIFQEKHLYVFNGNTSVGLSPDYLDFHQIVAPSYLACGRSQSDLIDKLEKGEQVKIVTLGTSLTGGKWPWVIIMKEWLEKDYPNQVTVVNMGVTASASMTVPAMEGNKSLWNRCGVDRIPEAIIAKPDVVFIEFAVNDAYQPYNITVSQSRKNLEQMIVQLKNALPGIEIILQTMNVVIDMPEQQLSGARKRPKLIGYYNMYREVAKNNNLLLIDNYSNWKKFLEKKGHEEYIKLVPDGIHPNLEGYRMVLLPELKRRLEYKI